MKILVGCESSGIVRDAMARRGHYAVSCDLLPSTAPGNHYEGDIFDIINEGWDMLIVHPPCTFVCRSGLHWNNRPEGLAIDRAAKTEAALVFVARLLAIRSIKKKALENPVGCISTRIHPASQYIQPYEFGEDASKKRGYGWPAFPNLCRLAITRRALCKAGNTPVNSVGATRPIAAKTS